MQDTDNIQDIEYRKFRIFLSGEHDKFMAESRDVPFEQYALTLGKQYYPDMHHWFISFFVSTFIQCKSMDANALVVYDIIKINKQDTSISKYNEYIDTWLNDFGLVENKDYEAKPESNVTFDRYIISSSTFRACLYASNSKYKYHYLFLENCYNYYYRDSD